MPKRVARRRAMDGKAEFHETARFIDPLSGEMAWVEVHGAAVPGAGGTPERVVGVAFNITERKRAEEVLRIAQARDVFLLALSDALRPLDDPDEIVYTAARVLGEQLGADRAYYVNLDEERQEFVVARDWHRPGETSHARRYPAAAWDMPWLDGGATWVMGDVDTDPDLPDAQRPAYRGNGIRAAIVVPLIKGARLVATFAANQALPRAWSATEVALVEDTAERIWAAVERARANAALRATGERLALLLQSMGEGVIGVAGDGRCTFVNAAGAALLGYRSGELAGKAVGSLLGGPDRRVLDALATGASARIEDALWRRGDGTAAALPCLVSPMLLDGQPAGAVIVFRA
jgi:PAS domain S-box-containing protein